MGAVAPSELVARIARLPRVTLGTYPTPLEPLPRLTAALGGPALWVKREDVTGPGLGGSKTRKLELLLAQAAASGTRRVATFGGLQSNFARQLAGAARVLGLEAHCFYFERRPRRLAGNAELARLLGARLHFVPLPAARGGSLTVEQASGLVRRLVRLAPSLWGRGAAFLPVGGRSTVGCLGEVLLACELEEQLADLGVERATVVTAAGTGGTLAGLLAGLGACPRRRLEHGRPAQLSEIS